MNIVTGKPCAVAPADAAARLAQQPTDAAFLTALGERVRATRMQCGLSRKALAELADVSERYLAQLESGRGNASSILLRRIARALGIRMLDLFGELDRERHLIMRFIDDLPTGHLTAVLGHLVSQFGAMRGSADQRDAFTPLRGPRANAPGCALAKEARRAFIELDK